MKKLNLLVLTLALTVLVQGWGVAQTPEAPSGSGTAEDPYLIETLNNLYWITQSSTEWDKHFIQTADIDASTTSGWDGGAGFLPIGNSSSPFTGSYDGQGGGIAMLSINRPSSWFVGFFGLLDGAVVKNLWIYSNTIIGKYYVGAIAGQTLNAALIENCYVTSSSEYSIEGVNFVGGVVGSLEDGSVINRSSSVAAISGQKYVGGLAGRNLATITECYASGSVNGTISNEGGLVGCNTAPVVSNSFWDTEASGQQSSAGGTGKTTAEMTSLATYTSTSTVGLSTPWDFVGTPNNDSGIADWWNIDESGGFLGYYPSPSYIDYPKSPTGSGTEADPYQIATLNNLYWLTETSAAWDAYIKQTADIAAYSTKYIGCGKGFLPIAMFDTFYGSYDGQGHSITGLYINQNQDNTGFFSVMSGVVTDLHLRDVDITNTNPRTGSLAGFLRYTTIQRCSCTGAVQGVDCVGLFAGQAEHTNTMEECWTAGTVSGYDYVGGLIGRCGGGAIELAMSNCYSRADVSGNNIVGGLIGHLPMGYLSGLSIVNCYSTGTVTGTTNVCGLFWYKYTTLENVTLTANFWDTESSGLIDGVGNIDPDPTGVNGKNTTELKTESTFTDDGWDFVGESTNGTDDIWDIDGTGVTNDGYPFLSYQPTNLTWNGSAGTSWIDAANWSGSNAVPTSAKSVIIPDVSNNPIISSAVELSGLNIQSGGVLTIAPAGSLNVNGTLTNSTGNSGLVIQSTAAGTGSLISSTLDVPATVQRYIDGSSAWHLVSSPIGEATAETFSGHYLQFFTEPTADWTDIISPSTTLAPAQGYSLWSGEETYTFEGNLNSGDISIATTQDYEDPAEETYYGWNLVGNPYPSSIDWAHLDDTWGAVYCYTGTTYATWNNGAQTNGGTQYLAPGQGFFISSDGSDFQLTNAMRSHEGKSDYFKNDAADMLLLRVENQQGGDEVCIRQQSGASKNFDRQFDAWKIMADNDNTGQLYTFADNGSLSIDTRPECTEIQLGFTYSQNGWFTFSLSEIHDFTSATIEDTKTSKRSDLLESPYDFNWESGDNEMRFKLHLNVVGINENQITPIAIGESDIRIYAADGQIIIKNKTDDLETRGRASLLTISDIMGRTVLQQAIGGSDLISIPVNYKTGVYLVTVENGDEVKTEKVFIK